MIFLKSLLLLALFSSVAHADFNPHNDTFRLGNKQSSSNKTIVFDTNQGASDPQLSCTVAGVCTMTTGSSSGTYPFPFPTNSPTAGYVPTATSSTSAAWQPTTGVLPGTGIIFFGPICPSGYLAANGAAVSRTTYSALFAADTIQTTANLNSTTTLSGIPSTTNMAVGMAITGTGIPSAATIASIVNSTSITISAAATSTASGVSIVVYAYGAGDGSTTFNVANLSGLFPRGAGSQTIGGRTYTTTIGSYVHDATAVNGLYDSGHSHQQLYTTAAGGGQNLGTGGVNGNNVYGGIYTNTASANLLGDAETRPANVGVLYCVKY